MDPPVTPNDCLPILIGDKLAVANGSDCDWRASTRKGAFTDRPRALAVLKKRVEMSADMLGEHSRLSRAQTWGLQWLSLGLLK